MSYCCVFGRREPSWFFLKSFQINQTGASLIEILVTSGVMLTLLLAFTTLFLDQQKSIRSLHQKHEIVDLKNIIQQQFMNPAVCTWQLQGKTIDVSMPTSKASPSPTSLELAEIRHGLNATTALISKAGETLPTSNYKLKVDKIKFKNIYATGNPQEFLGFLEISFDLNFLALPEKPIQIPQIITVDPGSLASDPAHAIIASCQPAGIRQDRSFFTKRSIVQSLPTSAYTKVLWDTNSWDTSGDMDLTLSEFRPTVAGRYFLQASVSSCGMISPPSHQFWINIFKNGVSHAMGSMWVSFTGLNCPVSTITPDRWISRVKLDIFKI